MFFGERHNKLDISRSSSRRGIGEWEKTGNGKKVEENSGCANDVGGQQ